MQERVSTRALSTVSLRRSFRRNPTEWEWGFRSADPLLWLTAASFLSRLVIRMDRYFSLNFRPIRQAPHDIDRFGDTTPDPVGGEKQEADVKETVEAQRVVYVI